MKRIVAVAAVLAIAAARPETYKETEDFQYSRSSTDEGTKSGYYGAQRGNVGGNFERAHNMDGLAQHQLSSAIGQVHGEVGDASNAPTGAVFTSANTRGTYGGRYDTSNLQGRNFQEGGRDYSSSSSQNSAYTGLSSSSHRSGYGSQSLNTGYSGYGRSQGASGYDQTIQSGNLQAAGSERDSAYDSTRQVGSHSSGYQSQSGYHSQSSYDSSNANQQSHSGYSATPQHRLVITSPARVIFRPGTVATIPVGVQTYDSQHQQQLTSHSASTLDQNSINTEAEVLSNHDQTGRYRPSAGAKGYESSYSYNKHWEKHDTKPEIIALSIPTESPFPRNSELYEDSVRTNAEHHASGSENAYSSSLHSGYNTKSASTGRSQYQAAGSQHTSAANSNTNAYTHGAYNSGSSADTTNILGEGNGNPKAYQSSYSYHKAWERQGDPYEIRPDGTTVPLSQKLTSLSNNQGYSSSSNQYNSQYRKGHQSYTRGSGYEDCDCDENGHIRVARSTGTSNHYNTYKQNQQYEQQLTWDNLGQETENKWENIEDLGQQAQKPFGKIEDLGQRTDNKWDQIQEGGEQRPDAWGDLGQQSQNQWGKIEDVGQQTQNKWDRIEDLGQQAQNKWDRVEDLGQQAQNKWEPEDLGQQATSGWNNQPGQAMGNWPHLRNFDQSQTDFGRDSGTNFNIPTNGELNDKVIKPNDTNSPWVGTGDIRTELQNPWDVSKDPQTILNQHQEPMSHSAPQFNPYLNLGRNENDFESQNTNIDFTQQNIDKVEQVEQSYLKPQEQEDIGQQTHPSWGVMEVAEQKPSSFNDKSVFDQTQETQKVDKWNNFANFYNENVDSTNIQKNKFSSQTGTSGIYEWSPRLDQNQTNLPKTGTSFDSIWDKINNFDGLSTNGNGKQEQIEINNHDKHTGVQQSQANNNIDHFETWLTTMFNKTVTSTTTLKPENKVDVDYMKNLNFNDIGRGDIGPEEPAVVTETVDKPFGYAPTPHKTDIEVPSIPQEMTKTFDDSDLTKHESEAKLDQGSVKPNEKTYQQWLQEQSQHSGNENQKSISTSNQRTDDNISETSDQKSIIQYFERDYKPSSTHNEGFIPRRPARPELMSHHKEAAQTSTANVEHESIYNFEQQLVQDHFAQHLNSKPTQTIEKFENVWGQNVDDFYRNNKETKMAENFNRKQTIGGESENNQQQQIDHELAETFGKGLTVSDDSNIENVNILRFKKEPEILQAPELSKQEKELHPPKNEEIEMILVPSTTTPKPGFWKNVKNKVSNWFSSSN